MKLSKLLKLALLFIGIVSLTSCGNYEIGLGSFTFTKVHIQMYGMEEPVHLEVEKWQSDEGGIELDTKNYGHILLGDGTYMMYDSKECPICGEVEYK